MTTQREVIEAFIQQESAPNVASNLRRAYDTEHEATEYLCGGRDGREVVIAKRDPINAFTLYRNYPFLGMRMRTTHVRRVAREFRRAVTRLEDDVEMNLHVHDRRGEEAPLIDADGSPVSVDL